MGTHPIFESDFDCLTECRKDQREVGNIFEEVDEDEYENIREKRSENWMVGDDRGYYDDGEEFYDNSDDEKVLSKEEKKKLVDAKKRKKFAAGSANITSMFLQSKKKKKTKSKFF